MCLRLPWAMHTCTCTCRGEWRPSQLFVLFKAEWAAAIPDMTLPQPGCSPGTDVAESSWVLSCGHRAPCLSQLHPPICSSISQQVIRCFDRALSPPCPGAESSYGNYNESSNRGSPRAKQAPWMGDMLEARRALVIPHLPLSLPSLASSLLLCALSKLWSVCFI